MTSFLEEMGTNRSDGVASDPDRTESLDLVLDVQNVTKVYGSGPLAVDAVNGVSFSVRAGELVAIMGASGSGKSSLLQLCGGLEAPTTGDVTVEGELLAGLGPTELAAVRRQHCGYVFQSFNLISSLTAAENISLPLELDGRRARQASKVAVDLLAEFGLSDCADRFPEELSGGQQQRVAIARALAGNRRLILADEPTGALDSATGDAVLQLLRSRIDAGAAGVLVTHEARHAAWADRTLFLRDGIVVDDTGSSLS